MQHTEFPKFVPDQLLTPLHLNQVFDYLDEQERLTRRCLIGIGIGCGLVPKANATGTGITITHGSGVTSEGYLIPWEERTFNEFVAFDPVKERYYDRFVDTAVKQKRFDLWELVEAGTVEASQPLSGAFLADKVVLLFVELLEENNKNCDPNSCDNKGVKVTVTFRPLLVTRTDAEHLIGESNGGGELISLQLPELRMRRFDVPATRLDDTASVFRGYLKLLDGPFLGSVESALSAAYQRFLTLVADLYPTNPFAGLANRLRFLFDGSLSVTQLLHVQYYFDLFSDVLEGYAELRRCGAKLSGVCCPDPDLFPRHLLLGEAQGFDPSVRSDYRHYFVPSPMLGGHSETIKELRSLQIRLVLLTDLFTVPPAPVIGGKLAPDFLRITPSVLGRPLSEKAIPYYYRPNEGAHPLYQYWSFAKSEAGEPRKNLSYHAASYNVSDNFVRQPLLYDLEPYNFFRIEGHIGQSYRTALASILKQRASHRLPFDAIALGTNARALLKGLSAIATAAGSAKEILSAERLALTRSQCQFRDLESFYLTLRDEFVCFLCKEMKFYYGLNGPSQLPKPSSTVPSSKLLRMCDSKFRFAEQTIGHQFELWYDGIRTQPYIPAAALLSTTVFSTFAMFATTASPIAGLSEMIGRTSLHQLVLLQMYYVEKLSETLATALGTFDYELFEERFDDMQKVALALSKAARGAGGDFGFELEEALDHVDKLLYTCNPVQFGALIKSFESRFRQVLLLRTLLYYAVKCPGLQHKAGVPAGGTFILVYHEKAPSQDAGTGTFIGRETNILRETESNVFRATGNVGLEITNRPATHSEFETLIANEGLSTDLGLIERVEDAEFAGFFATPSAPEAPGLVRLIDELPDETVIADFYVPFLCCSECPPIQYVIPPEKNPPVSLTIVPLEFCGSNPGPIPIQVSPPGGELTGEGTRPERNGFVFIPSDVILDGETSVKEVTITYRVDDQSYAAKVKVFRPPVAAFELGAGSVPGMVVTRDQSQFAQAYRWNFGDNTPDEISQNPTHQYTKSGTYTVTLRVTNGQCTSDATRNFTVQLDTQPPRQCLAIARLVEEFKALRNLNPDLFPRFQEGLDTYSDIEKFFEKLAGAGSMSPDEEIEFYGSQQVVERLPVWLSSLHAMIRSPELRLLALELYRILANLVMRIACFQDKDVDAAKIPMAEILVIVNRHAQEWRRLEPPFNPQEQERIKIYATDATDERDRLNADEASQKPHYGEALATLIVALMRLLS